LTDYHVSSGSGKASKEGGRASAAGRQEPLKGGWFTQILNSFIRNPDISPEAKVLAFVFASYADARGVAFPGTGRLVRETGMSRYRVTRARSELVRNGFLRKHFTRGTAGKFTQRERQPAVTFEVSEKILRRPFARESSKR